MGWFTKKIAEVETPEQRLANERRAMNNWKPRCLELATQAGRDPGCTLVQTAQSIWEFMCLAPPPEAKSDDPA